MPKSKGQNQLFLRSRIQLAVWYAGVMGSILALLGLGVYRAIAHAHEVTIDREIKSVADAIHDAIEINVSSAAELNSVPARTLPNLCIAGDVCSQPTAGPPYPLQDTSQNDYYIRIVDLAGNLLATGGIRPSQLPLSDSHSGWEVLEDGSGQEYHQVSISLENRTQATWAYLQVGRSFQNFEQYLSVVRWSLVGGFLLSLLVVAVASWWLSDMAMRPIYQSYQQIQQFTADAAHELRTPLAAIRATVESVLRVPKLSEEEAQETLGVVSRQTQRLTSLVSDLLLLSRLDSEKPLPEKKRCNLQDILSDIVEEMSAFAIAKQITLNGKFQVQTPLIVRGDEEQLYRLVLNLVNNAIVYTPAGGRVTIYLTSQSQQALIQISDTGMGISPEQQKKIFDRFYRVDEARSSQVGSSGLGLAIASAIAKAHEGTLTVTSQIGQGSTFTLSLPLSS